MSARIADKIRQHLQVLLANVDYLGDPLRVGGDDEQLAAADECCDAIEALAIIASQLIERDDRHKRYVASLSPSVLAVSGELASLLADDA